MPYSFSVSGMVYSLQETPAVVIGLLDWKTADPVPVALVPTQTANLVVL